MPGLELSSLEKSFPSRKQESIAGYADIRRKAIEILEEEIKTLSSGEKLDAKEEKIKRMQKGIEEISNDSFISLVAKTNNWEGLREKNINSNIDEDLTNGLLNRYGAGIQRPRNTYH